MDRSPVSGGERLGALVFVMRREKVICIPLWVTGRANLEIGVPGKGLPLVVLCFH